MCTLFLRLEVFLIVNVLLQDNYYITKIPIYQSVFSPVLHRFPFVPFECLQACEYVTRHCTANVSEIECVHLQHYSCVGIVGLTQWTAIAFPVH